MEVPRGARPSDEVAAPRAGTGTPTTQPRQTAPAKTGASAPEARIWPTNAGNEMNIKIGGLQPGFYIVGLTPQRDVTVEKVPSSGQEQRAGSVREKPAAVVASVPERKEVTAPQAATKTPSTQPRETAPAKTGAPGPEVNIWPTNRGKEMNIKIGGLQPGFYIVGLTPQKKAPNE
jgi:hypothetical protein